MSKRFAPGRRRRDHQATGAGRLAAGLRGTSRGRTPLARIAGPGGSWRGDQAALGTRRRGWAFVARRGM